MVIAVNRFEWIPDNNKMSAVVILLAVITFLLDTESDKSQLQKRRQYKLWAVTTELDCLTRIFKPVCS